MTTYELKDDMILRDGVAMSMQEIVLDLKAKTVLEEKIRELYLEKCRACADYGLCCSIGRCGRSYTGCFKK